MGRLEHGRLVPPLFRGIYPISHTFSNSNHLLCYQGFCLTTLGLFYSFVFYRALQCSVFTFLLFNCSIIIVTTQFTKFVSWTRGIRRITSGGKKPEVIDFAQDSHVCARKHLNCFLSLRLCLAMYYRLSSQSPGVGNSFWRKGQNRPRS